MSDPVVRMLQRLPALTPGEARAARVRARCRAELARQQERRAPRQADVHQMFEQVLAGLSLAYLTAIAREMWRMFRL